MAVNPPSSSPTPASPATANAGFAFRQDQFQQMVEDVLALAKRLGASDAGAEVSEGVGLSVSVRKGELENVERNRDKSLGVSVYLGQRRGNASTSDFSPQAVEQTVRAAFDIARFTAEDPAAGLPDAEDIATPDDVARDLQLFHPWAIDAEGAAALALRCEAAATAVSRKITNSDGAGVSAQQSHFWAGNSRGFRGGYASSRHSLSVAPIAGRGRNMQRDAWYSSMRDPAELASAETIGRYAAERALSRLGARRVATATVPVLFESTVAAGLLGSFVQAVSGGSLYRGTSFLLNSLGQAVMADHLDILEEPHQLKGKGSA
ncbi:MAG: metallopeptidase TldD-related protein, partial [Rubrivivax sp.]